MKQVTIDAYLHKWDKMADFIKEVDWLTSIWSWSFKSVVFENMQVFPPDTQVLSTGSLIVIKYIVMTQVYAPGSVHQPRWGLLLIYHNPESTSQSAYPSIQVAFSQDPCTSNGHLCPVSMPRQGKMNHCPKEFPKNRSIFKWSSQAIDRIRHSLLSSIPDEIALSREVPQCHSLECDPLPSTWHQQACHAEDQIQMD